MMRPWACEGSGLCCMKGPCELYWLHIDAIGSPIDVENWHWQEPWTSGRGCPKLVWDPEANRYWCGIILSSKEHMRPFYEELLSVGAGCCMPLFNDEKRYVRRVEKDPEELQEVQTSSA
jgi:hypothetical protein